MAIRLLILASAVASAVVLVSCSTVPPRLRRDPSHLIERACAPGKAVRAARGSVWMKASSKEASGQFPAEVDVENGKALRVEVTSLLGATEALITVTPERYVIEIPGKKERKALRDSGEGSWGGIPLRWAPDLFLGRIPCPAPEQLASASLAMDSDDALIVQTRGALSGGAERFEYHFRDYAGDRWPEALVWERAGALGKRVEFKFDDPEEQTQSPKKWEARSSSGEVKVRWKDRAVVR
jgi:hypothetical protein